MKACLNVEFYYVKTVLESIVNGHRMTNWYHEERSDSRVEIEVSFDLIY